MSQIEDAIREHEDRCKKEIEKKLVPWTWMIGIIVTILLSIGGTSWFLASSYAGTATKAELSLVKCVKLEKRLDKLEIMQTDITWIRQTLQERIIDEH